ncbi:hypothetical protein [Kaarinaea lacus]
MTNPVYIYSTSGNTWPTEEQAPELKDTVKTLWGKGYRRISHFIQLALVGAKRCADNSTCPIDAQCNIVFTTGQGNISNVAKVTRQIFKEHEPPMPFDFMHITNNMAPFYVAQGLGLSSSNLTVAHRSFPFETAIDLAAFQLQTTNGQYFIGAVDECAFPLNEHRQRLGLPPHTPLAEGSHWLLLGSESRHAIAQLEFCYFCHTQEELVQQVVTHRFKTPVTLSCGFGINNEEQQWWQDRLSTQDYYDYRQHTAYHDTAAAYGVVSFIEQHHAQTMIHINKSARQRYCVVCVSAF